MAKSKSDKSGGSSRGGSGSKEKDQSRGQSSGAGAGRGQSPGANPGRSGGFSTSRSSGAGAGRGGDPRNYGGGSSSGGGGPRNKSDLRDDNDRARQPRPQMRPDKPLPGPSMTRPQPRPAPDGPMPLSGYAAMTPAERLREQQMAEQFAALEARADIDPWLANDPMRRLGYRETGGLMNVDYMPLDPNNAWHFGGGYNRLSFDEELRKASETGLEPPVFGSIEMMQPERAAAFLAGETPNLIPERGIMVGPNYFSEPIMAHESGHAGLRFVQDAINNNQAYANEYVQRGFDIPSQLPEAYEEGVIEIGDNPLDTWVQPWSTGPVGTYGTMEHTVQYLPEEGSMMRNELEAYNALTQRIAQEELARRGEPPRAVMQQPGPGNMFYQEPEINQGIGGLFSGIRGLFD